MGGRGAGSAGGSGGGGKTNAPRIKSDIGVKRDEIKNSVRYALKGKTFNKNVQDENGKHIDIHISGIDSKHITVCVYEQVCLAESFKLPMPFVANLLIYRVMCRFYSRNLI